MLKHATITRTNRAQKALQLQKQLMVNQDHQSSEEPPSSLESFANSSDFSSESVCENPLLNDTTSPIWQLPNQSFQRLSTPTQANSCSSSPTPSNLCTPISKFPLSPSAPSSVFSSPNKLPQPTNGLKISDSCSGLGSTTTITTTNGKSTSMFSKSGSDSMIKVFAQTLSQDVEYVTLHINAQTKSQQIVRSLLRKFRLKHRDPNLFYLTLERWIRKDGLRFKSVMLLSDEACPLQLQQCCSNPPHNDIKFTLQMRSGALMKIHCSDVCPDVRYKCLSLSSQTTVDETIELMLHCLNLSGNSTSNGDTGGTMSSTSLLPNNSSNIEPAASIRLSSSPSLQTDSSSSSSSSSSSGIESDPTTTTSAPSNHHQINLPANRQLDSNSRTSSLTSISSASNMSSSSSSQLSEQFCLVIECGDTNYRKVLESDDYLVDIYQSLLDEVREQPALDLTSAISSDISPITSPSNNSIKQQPDQWFIIKLKRRDDIIQQPSIIKFTNPRQNMPLPPIPLSLAQQNNANDLKHIVTTTQIELNHQNNTRPQVQPPTTLRRNQQQLTHWTSNSSMATMVNNKPLTINTNIGATIADTVDGSSFDVPMTTMTLGRPNSHHHLRQASAIPSVRSDNSFNSNTNNSMPPPPASLIWLPPVQPRRRNLSNVSTSTFGRPQAGASVNFVCNRRRYDPAQLAEDLEKLDMGCDTSSPPDLPSINPTSEDQPSELDNEVG